MPELPAKKFTVINTPFICEMCGHENPPAEKTCRNHCRQCLSSKHVDKNPGDRAESCHGTLKPIDFEYKAGIPERIIFLCTKCGKKRINKIADDDNRDTIWAVLAERKI
jgi:DNA-directed RNA polymerase subunit RPC12/RpoP